MKYTQDYLNDILIRMAYHSSAIVDRSLHHSHVVKITGNSYRLKDFFQKADE